MDGCNFGRWLLIQRVTVTLNSYGAYDFGHWLDRARHFADVRFADSGRRYVRLAASQTGRLIADVGRLPNSSGLDLVDPYRHFPCSCRL